MGGPVPKTNVGEERGMKIRLLVGLRIYIHVDNNNNHSLWQPSDAFVPVDLCPSIFASIPWCSIDVFSHRWQPSTKVTTFRQICRHTSVRKRCSGSVSCKAKNKTEHQIHYKGEEYHSELPIFRTHPGPLTVLYAIEQGVLVSTNRPLPPVACSRNNGREEAGLMVVTGMISYDSYPLPWEWYQSLHPMTTLGSCCHLA